MCSTWRLMRIIDSHQACTGPKTTSLYPFTRALAGKHGLHSLIRTHLPPLILVKPWGFLMYQLPYFKDSICNHTLLETNIMAAWRSDAWKMILEKTCHVLRWRWNFTSIKGFPFDTFSKNSWNQIKPPKKQNRPSVWSMGFMFLFSKQKKSQVQIEGWVLAGGVKSHLNL